MKYTVTYRIMHFMVTKFSYFYFLWVS